MNRWNLLIVDDEDFNLEIICEYLEGGPYRLLTAENGEAAWRILEKNEPAIDAIILDRMMPVMDGMTLLKQIKSDSRFSAIPVIMQTAAASHEQIREGLAAGCYYYLTKPYKAAALNCIVQTVLEELRSQRVIEAHMRIPSPIPSTPSAEYTFSTLEEAQRLAMMLAVQCPNPGLAAIGLQELLINAIEHGNLGMTYAEKTRLKIDQQWEEEIASRLKLSRYQSKKASIRFERTDRNIVFTITDEGDGFDWNQYLDFDPGRAFDPNGRGIAMANKVAFSALNYQGRGNQVVASISLDTPEQSTN
jgi:CheY-like chemotaxis protein